MDTLTLTDQRTATMKTIFERRAVRKYKPDKVDKKIIEKIIEAGRMAPSAMNSQGWNFTVITNSAMIKSLSKKITKVAGQHFPLLVGVNLFTSKDIIFHGAPVVIFLSSPGKDSWSALNIGMCAQNMMLAAKSMGLDTCPIGLAKFVEETDMMPVLKIPKGGRVQLAIALGHGDEEPKPHKRKKENITFIE